MFLFLYKRPSIRDDSLQEANRVLKTAISSANASRKTTLEKMKKQYRDKAASDYEKSAELFLEAAEAHMLKYPETKFNYESCVNSAKKAYSNALRYSDDKKAFQDKIENVFGKRVKMISSFLSGNEYLKRARGLQNPAKRRQVLDRAETSFEKALKSSSNPKFKSALESIVYQIRKSKIIHSLIFFSLSLFFSGLSFTGAVVGTAKHDFNFLGILFFVCSLVCAFVWCRKKFF